MLCDSGMPHAALDQSGFKIWTLPHRPRTGHRHGPRQLTDPPSVSSAASPRAATAAMSQGVRKYSTSDSTIKSKRPLGHPAGMRRHSKQTYGRSLGTVRAVQRLLDQISSQQCIAANCQHAREHPNRTAGFEARSEAPLTQGRDRAPILLLLVAAGLKRSAIRAACIEQTEMFCIVGDSHGSRNVSHGSSKMLRRSTGS